MIDMDDEAPDGSIFSVRECNPGLGSLYAPGSKTDTDVQVFAKLNQGSPDSMFVGEAGLQVFAAPVISASLAQNGFQVINSANWLYDTLQGVKKGIENEGELVITDPKERLYTIDYFGTIEKTSAPGNVNIGIVVLKDGNIASFNAPRHDNAGKIQTKWSNNISAKKDDILKVAVINYDPTAANIGTSQAGIKLSIS